MFELMDTHNLILCPLQEESDIHILFHCHSAASIWNWFSNLASISLPMSHSAGEIWLALSHLFATRKANRLLDLAWSLLSIQEPETSQILKISDPLFVTCASQVEWVKAVRVCCRPYSWVVVPILLLLLSLFLFFCYYWAYSFAIIEFVAECVPIIWVSIVEMSLYLMNWLE